LGVIACLWCALVTGRVAAAPVDLDLLQTVVVANGNVPDSVELARHYLAARGISEDRLCVLDLPAGETMARWYYEERLRDPLQAFLRERGLVEQVRRDPDSLAPHTNPWRTLRHTVRTVVLMYGVPLRVAETRPFLTEKLNQLAGRGQVRDGAAVDSELACLLWDPYDIAGWTANPLYNMVYWSRHDRQPSPVLIVGRLDGPDPETVRRMIDDTLAAEREGLTGRAYVDLQGIREADYRLGDHWMEEAAHRLSRHGMDVIMDRDATLFPPYFPMGNAAIYLGWYAEHAAAPFTHDAFRFRRGAIAYHLHSGSARTLRSTDRHWVGPLLHAGAAAALGAVDEPYLQYTPDLQVFIDRLVSGYSYGESAYFAQRVLSWQITVVGDPLYRPFARPLEDAVAAFERGDAGQVWAVISRVNRMIQQQQFNPALEVLREALRRMEHPVLREKLGDLYARNGLIGEAIREWEAVLDHAGQDDAAAMRSGRRLAGALRAAGNQEQAGRVVERLRTDWPDSIWLPFLESTP
jgi:uncharacterized protein (TIGR03790 family)